MPGWNLSIRKLGLRFKTIKLHSKKSKHLYFPLIKSLKNKPQLPLPLCTKQSFRITVKKLGIKISKGKILLFFPSRIFLFSHTNLSYPVLVWKEQFNPGADSYNCYHLLTTATTINTICQIPFQAFNPSLLPPLFSSC